MEHLFSLDNLFTLGMLILLQAVLGFDNLLYISLESKRAPAHSQADKVSEFLQKNRMYEVMGLFILFVVGIMLLTEGGHMAGLQLAGYEIVPMTKATFYFVIVVLVLSDVVQSRYRKKMSKAIAGRKQS